VVSFVDVVVVSYNSAEHLRSSVEPLCRIGWAQVYVVDNASSDGSVASVGGLPLETISLMENLGFAGGCNVGWRAGKHPYVLFLNPDAQIDADSLRLLVSALESETTRAIAAPKIVAADGTLQYSLRRFPRLRSTFAQALFLHRLSPTATWADEIIRTPVAYASPGEHDWASGACLLVRRDVLERLDGWDAGFFFYCEDIDLCRRARDAGFTVWYEPGASVVHDGGGSAARSAMLPHLAASRVRYAGLHRSRPAAVFERLGIALEALTRLLAGRGGRATRVGHARSLRVAIGAGRQEARPA
jgi:GT2 family glycosyltransferase